MERGQGRRKGRPLATFALWRLVTVVLALLLCACAQDVMGPHGRKPLLLSGTERPDRAPGSLLRADPGYIQWLERQSMLGNADDLAAEVSGSERLWGNSGSNDRLPLLLDAAPCWLEVNPHTLRGKATAMQSVPQWVPMMPPMGCMVALQEGYFSRVACIKASPSSRSLV